MLSDFVGDEELSSDKCRTHYMMRKIGIVCVKRTETIVLIEVTEKQET